MSFGELAKPNRNFCVNWWATSFLITLFMGCAGEKEEILFRVVWSICTPCYWFSDPSNYKGALSLLFIIAFFFFFKHQGSKGRAVWGSEKANCKAFFQLILVFSSWGSSLPHTKTKLASVPQKILRDFVLITENCSESHKLSHLSCGIFRAALGEKASSL